jgi:hypothetical protein
VVLTINTPIPINIRHAEHLINIRIGDIIANRAQDTPQLVRTNRPALVLVEDGERFAELGFGIAVFDFAGHED